MVHIRGSVEVIKFTAFVSILFLILTYIITINIETHRFELNTIWLSNNFALTIFGGAFASMLVVLLCEIQKYITVKASVKEYIFYQALYLYQSLFLMQQNICDYQNNPEMGVPDNLLEGTTKMIQSEVFALQNTDYAPFKKDDFLMMAHQKFCKETARDMQPIMEGDNGVKIAIAKVKINYLQQNILNKVVTSVEEPLQTVLSIQLDRVSNALDEVDKYLEDIDKYCNYQYDWKKQRKQIHSSYVNIFEAWDFERVFQK